MAILEHLDNLLVTGQDGMLYNRISKRVELMARIAYKATLDVQVRIPRWNRALVEARPEQTHIRYTPRTHEITSQLRELLLELPQLYSMSSKVENEEVRYALLTDISDLQVCIQNALKEIKS